jgi:ketosteroid isomerase-like protein
MKKQLVVLAIVCMIETRCSQTPKNYTMSTDKIKNVETVSKMYESMSAKDIKKWISYWAEDGVQYIPYSPDGFPKAVEGKKQLSAIYTSLLAGYGELKYTHIDIEAMDNPNKVLVRWGVDIELKGKTEHYQNELIGIFEFEDGKVKRFTEYFNPLQFMKAIK